MRRETRKTVPGWKDEEGCTAGEDRKYIYIQSILREVWDGREGNSRSACYRWKRSAIDSRFAHFAGWNCEAKSPHEYTFQLPLKIPHVALSFIAATTGSAGRNRKSGEIAPLSRTMERAANGAENIDASRADGKDTNDVTGRSSEESRREREK